MKKLFDFESSATAWRHMIGRELILAGLLVGMSMTDTAFADAQLDAKSVHAAEVAKALDASELQLRGDSPNKKYNFAVGEEMVMDLTLSGVPKNSAAKYKVKIEKLEEGGVHETEVREIEPGKPLKYTTRAVKPGFSIIRATLLDENGKMITRKDAKPVTFVGGLGVDLASVKPEAAPDDFDEYWDNEVKKLYAAEAPKAVLTQVPYKQDNIKLYAFEIPTPGSAAPSTGLIAIPVKAGKYPALVQFWGYGPVTSLKHIKYPADTITMQVSRFGIKPLQSDDYYAEKREQLGRYGFSGNEDRESSFFKGMLLRDLRALQYLKSLPEWNGKALTVKGGSMAGLQCLWMCGLDKDVSAADISFPWCCDMQDPELKRIPSNFAPKYTPALRYFDPVNFARRIKPSCQVKIYTGIGDMVCPVNGVFRAYVAIPSTKKTLTLMQKPTHAPGCKNPQRYVISGNVGK